MSRPLFRTGSKIKDSFSADTYEITHLLGQGGFGQVYQAELLGRTGKRQPKGRGTVCLKVTLAPEAWHGEAYFGLLTRGLPNVVQHRGSFPLRRRGGMRFILVLDLEQRGTVRDWILKGGKGWSPSQVVNALRPLARVLAQLHASGAMHRDVTPPNVFLGNRRSLKIGDFGIAKHGLDGRGARADAFNEGFVAASMRAGRAVWLPSDDVYQLGLVGLSLLLREEVTEPDWRSLRHRVTEPALRTVLQTATGPRRDRYASGVEFHAALCAISGSAQE